ncbi:MAG: tRNA preQ1(34) S-adenosylmethionine ribosyltransferase-isomerase QueA [Candidatus Cloacimonetes bacterium]|nr:tRNA preQ1(34) S-adenosylmethionine ribosyltransferase-isomerase QueA [Candidatus Cloacimonadota bacterium]
MHPDLHRKEAYHYDLPRELIAQYPLQDRDQSRLMHLACAAGEIHHRSFQDLPELLREGDLLVFNNSKVFPARIFGLKENGTRVEVLLLHPSTKEMVWKCLVHPGKRVKQDQWLTFSDTFRGYIHGASEEGIREIELDVKGDLFAELDRIGHIPLPPYIDRDDEAGDRDRYQTVYAREIGSVAAPTAGLHFSRELIDTLKQKGVLFTELTLHVGIGTFRPVKTENILEHTMHSECTEVSEATATAINDAKRDGRRVITVGTTSTRTVESFHDGQSMNHGKRWTDIFIYPGYNFKVPDAMITNFHLPESTLLMMISAFAGFHFIREAYAEAVAKRYRFFSYGDAMYIEL